MSGLAHQAQVILSMRDVSPGAVWTVPLLATASGLTQSETRDAVRALRNAGKIQFNRLALSASMLGAVACPPVNAASGAIIDEAAVCLPSGEPDAEPCLPSGEPDAGSQCTDAAGALETLPAAPVQLLPDRPTGRELLAEIRAWCVDNNVKQLRFGPMAGFSAGFVHALKDASMPKAETVVACRAVMGTADVPVFVAPPPSRKWRADFENEAPLTRDVEQIRAESDRRIAERDARFEAVARAEAEHRRRGQALLRAAPASAFIAKARQQMESGR